MAKQYAVITVTVTKKFVYEFDSSEEYESDIEAIEAFGEDGIGVEIYPDIDVVEMGVSTSKKVRFENVSKGKASKILDRGEVF